jgi:Uma2 family endonuclease
MNVHLPAQFDKEAFLAWANKHEERYELVDGRVVMMTGASLDHGRIVGNLYFSVRSRLESRWEVVADFGLDAGPRTLRYPDILVHRAGREGTNFTTNEPVFLAEVLSPSSEALDLGDKAAEYLRLPSLQAYLVLAQSEAKAWLWQRSDSTFAPGPTVIAGIEQSIKIAALSVDLPLSEIYHTIVFNQN